MFMNLSFRNNGRRELITEVSSENIPWEHPNFYVGLSDVVECLPGVGVHG